MAKYGKGWNQLISNLKEDVYRIAPNIEILDIREGQFGKLLFFYIGSDLTEKEKDLVNARVKRAEDVAWETCVECGRLGWSAWTREPPRARVFCKKHVPDGWTFIE